MQRWWHSPSLLTGCQKHPECQTAVQLPKTREGESQDEGNRKFENQHTVNRHHVHASYTALFYIKSIGPRYILCTLLDSNTGQQLNTHTHTRDTLTVFSRHQAGHKVKQLQ